MDSNENRKNDASYAEELDELSTVDLALELSDYEEEELKELCETHEDEELAGILEQSELKTQIRIIKILDNKRILRLFSYMSKDDIVDILGEVTAGKAKELINLMKEGDKKIINQLMGYRDDCAGGIMTTEYIKLDSSLLIKDAIAKIKEIVPKTELIDTIFVVNRSKKLIGTAKLRDILIAPEEDKLESITNEHYIYVEPETDQEEVSLLVSKYDLTAIPVLNKNKAMLGIITIDDIVDVMVEEHTEDILKIGGASKEETIDSTILESIKLRLPWLFVNLITAFLASMTVKSFESTIAQVVALSSIMSIVTGMGGNAGTQTVSIIIRNIAMKKVEFKDAGYLLGKQLLVNLVNGATIGAITGLIISVIYNNFYLGIIVFLAMIANLIISGICGILIPLVLAKAKLDPALSSTIFLTTATDVLGFFVFLSLANVFLPYLI
ncbi:MAG: magnesium transporter [Clostridia bacterium]|nr:magnesium transporter [Clostridia bacterium]MCI9275925.1 magnesium transporter [Clostridia bacterium]